MLGGGLWLLFGLRFGLGGLDDRFRINGQMHFSFQLGFVGEGADGNLVLDLKHELFPSPCGLAARTFGGSIVVVSEPNTSCELRNRTDEPEIAGVL